MLIKRSLKKLIQFKKWFEHEKPLVTQFRHYCHIFMLISPKTIYLTPFALDETGGDYTCLCIVFIALSLPVILSQLHYPDFFVMVSCCKFLIYRVAVNSKYTT